MCIVSNKGSLPFLQDNVFKKHLISLVDDCDILELLNQRSTYFTLTRLILTQY